MQSKRSVLHSRRALTKNSQANVPDIDRPRQNRKSHRCDREPKSLKSKGNKVRSTQPMDCLRSWVPTNVGGHRVSRPTSLVRDSSLWIEYGPRDCGVLSGSADRDVEYRGHQRLAPVPTPNFSKFSWRKQSCRTASPLCHGSVTSPPKAPRPALPPPSAGRLRSHRVPASDCPPPSAGFSACGSLR